MAAGKCSAADELCWALPQPVQFASLIAHAMLGYCWQHLGYRLPAALVYSCGGLNGSVLLHMHVLDSQGTHVAKPQSKPHSNW